MKNKINNDTQSVSHLFMNSVKISKNSVSTLTKCTHVRIFPNTALCLKLGISDFVMTLHWWWLIRKWSAKEWRFNSKHFVIIFCLSCHNHNEKWSRRCSFDLFNNFYFLRYETELAMLYWFVQQVLISSIIAVKRWCILYQLFVIFKENGHNKITPGARARLEQCTSFDLSL